MPIKTDIKTKHNKMFNLYVNEIEKCNFLLAVNKYGTPRTSSATIRAMMYLYSVDEEFRNKVNTIVNDFIVYKKNGEISQL